MDVSWCGAYNGGSGFEMVVDLLVIMVWMIDEIYVEDFEYDLDIFFN